MRSIPIGLLALMLVTFSCVSVRAVELVELYSRTVSVGCWGLSVNDSGVTCAIEVTSGDTLLAIYSLSGSTIKRWTPPRGTQFEACTSDESLVLAWYTNAVTLFGEDGREQLWGKRADELWPDSISLSAVAERVVFGDQPLNGSSTIWCFDTDGHQIWSEALDSLAVDTDISSNGQVLVGGEKYGLRYDSGVHAVYFYSEFGSLIWRHETDSPVIDVAVAHELGIAVAGLDNGDLLVLNMAGDLLWSQTEAGGWIDLSRSTGYVIAARQWGGVFRYTQAGEPTWSVDDPVIWGDRDGLCTDSTGCVIAVVGAPMICRGNKVQVLDADGLVLWEESSDSTVPCVSISPNGRYVAVSFARKLRLFEVVE